MKCESRRQFLQAAAIAAPSLVVANRLSAQIPDTINPGIGPYPAAWLPAGVRSRFVDDVNGLRMHVLEAGDDSGNSPALVLLHGFPELAYSWRKLMLPLANAGYHVIVPDLRGYGRTTGFSSDYDTDLTPFHMLNKVRDVMGLIYAYGYDHVDCVIGHDFGSPLAAWCAVTRPDIFQSLVMMSAPFGGTPSIPRDTIRNPRSATAGSDIYQDLANLSRPRKHYQRYYQTREANDNMWKAEQGLSNFIRAYYHHKSADWEGNQPYPLTGRTASEWAKMPTYYIMDLAEGMAETVAKVMPSDAEIAANTWLPDSELAVYANEFGRTGFQGGLNSYRMGSTGINVAESQLYAGKTIDQPSLFISGASDWGTYQNPGAVDRMQENACTDMRGVHLVDGAGHWVQQEQPEVTSSLILEFLLEIS
ncbi:MAG: alpha/beta hydrolase [Pseudomonadales bacterium]|nr:alpha/beta hydrolase [Pseudomonadales bacterium]